MKKLVLILGLIGIMALPGLAAAAEDAKPMGVYVGGHLGMSIENFSGRDVGEEGTNVWSSGNKTDTTFGGGISVGYDFDQQFNVPVRLELDYTARTQGEAKSSTTLDDGVNATEGPFDGKRKDKISLQTLMLNAWIDIPTGTAFTPYLGGGIGFGFVNYKANLSFIDTSGRVGPGIATGSTSDTNFAWSLGGGVAYDITQNWTVDLGYRYIDAGKVSKSFTDDGDVMKSKAKVQAHDIMLGVRYTF